MVSHINDSIRTGGEGEGEGLGWRGAQYLWKQLGQHCAKGMSRDETRESSSLYNRFLVQSVLYIDYSHL